MSASQKDRSAFGEILSGQMTPSAQYGLVVLILLIGFFGLKQFDGRVEQLRTDATRAASDLAVLSNDDAEKTWLARASSAESARDAWRDHTWIAASAGVAAAQLETALRDAADQSGLEKLQLNVNPDPIDRNSLSYLRFGFSAQVPPGQVHTLLAALATAKPDLIVTGLQLSAQQKGDMTIKVDGIAPFATD